MAVSLLMGFLSAYKPPLDNAPRQCMSAPSKRDMYQIPLLTPSFVRDGAIFLDMHSKTEDGFVINRNKW